MNDPLATYLHDHLGGARAAIDLLKAIHHRHQGEPLGDFAAVFLPEVEADRETLQRLAEKIGAGSHGLKELSGWLGETVTRLKLGQKSAEDFANFEALEFLALGVRGKMGMWQALEVAAEMDARLRGYNFKQLVTSAHTQYRMVEQQRLEAARTALAPRSEQRAGSSKKCLS